MVCFKAVTYNSLLPFCILTVVIFDTSPVLVIWTREHRSARESCRVLQLSLNALEKGLYNMSKYLDVH